MVAEDTPRRFGWPVRGLLMLVAVAAGGVPVYLLLPDAAIERALGWLFPPNLDLGDPELLTSWRGILSGAAGLLVCALFYAVVLWLRRRLARARRRREERAPLAALRRALKSQDPGRISAAVREVAERRGEEVVDELVVELGRAGDPNLRLELAAALYQVGRAVTAEVELLPRG